MFIKITRFAPLYSRPIPCRRASRCLGYSEIGDNGLRARWLVTDRAVDAATDVATFCQSAQHSFLWPSHSTALYYKLQLVYPSVHLFSYGVQYRGSAPYKRWSKQWRRKGFCRLGQKSVLPPTPSNGQYRYDYNDGYLCEVVDCM